MHVHMIDEDTPSSMYSYLMFKATLTTDNAANTIEIIQYFMQEPPLHHS